MTPAKPGTRCTVTARPLASWGRWPVAAVRLYACPGGYIVRWAGGKVRFDRLRSAYACAELLAG